MIKNCTEPATAGFLLPANYGFPYLVAQLLHGCCTYFVQELLYVIIIIRVYCRVVYSYK